MVHHFSNGAPFVSGTLALAVSRVATSSSLMRQPKPPAHRPNAVIMTAHYKHSAFVWQRQSLG
jgi:hypothetical protein